MFDSASSWCGIRESASLSGLCLHCLILPTPPLLSSIASEVYYWLEQWGSVNMQSGPRRITVKGNEAQLMWGAGRGRDIYDNTSSALTHTTKSSWKASSDFGVTALLEKTTKVFSKLFLLNSEETVLKDVNIILLSSFLERVLRVCVCTVCVHSFITSYTGMET